MGRKRSVDVGGKVYMVDVSESEGRWVAGVCPVSGSPGCLPIWTCEAESEEAVLQQVDSHLAVLKLRATQG
jgi:hypothetical protein